MTDGMKDRAQDLGRLLGQSDEYKALGRARERLTEDKEAVASMTRLDALEREALYCSVLPLRKELWGASLDFLENFADRLHHGKEEGLLFPALEAAGMCLDHGPTMSLRREHAHERELRACMTQCVVLGHSEPFLDAFRRIRVLLRLHIRKEDKILFRMAREMLGWERSMDLIDRFSRAGIRHVDRVIPPSRLGAR